MITILVKPLRSVGPRCGECPLAPSCPCSCKASPAAERYKRKNIKSFNMMLLGKFLRVMDGDDFADGAVGTGAEILLMRRWKLVGTTFLFTPSIL